MANAGRTGLHQTQDRTYKGATKLHRLEGYYLVLQRSEKSARCAHVLGLVLHLVAIAITDYMLPGVVVPIYG